VPPLGHGGVQGGHHVVAIVFEHGEHVVFHVQLPIEVGAEAFDLVKAPSKVPEASPACGCPGP
jgi:hypothetical protein